MTEFGFPKEGKSQELGRSGEAFLQQFVVGTLGWVYRPVHQEADFGIDALAEVKLEGSVTGRGLAFQVKCGGSYLAKRTAGGIRYEGSRQQLNYYLNQSVPVVLIVVSCSWDEAYWVDFDINRTTETSTGWWTEIPRANRVNASVAEQWAALAGPVQDYSQDIQLLWHMDKLFSSTEYRSVALPMDEVHTCSMEFIDSLLTRLSKTLDLALENRGKLEIFFRGYDSDPREIYEIEEVRRWFSASLAHSVPWFYFLDTRLEANGLRMLLFCTCDCTVTATRGTRRLIAIDPEQRARFLEVNFANLNHFTESRGISLEVNRERSEAVLKCLMQFEEEA